MAESNKPKIPVICVVGPTASGKTALSIALAKKYDAEIVSCDSMQIYKDMCIGTAKPSVEEMDGVPHHLIDFLDLSENFSVAQYVKLANESIQEIRNRQKNVVIVGGTGLYFSSLIDNLNFSENDSDPALRAELEEIGNLNGGEYLLDMLKELDPEMATKLHPNNMGRIIRAIEVCKTTKSTMTEQQRLAREQASPFDPVIIGLDFSDRQKLYDRINLRVDLMLENGLMDENRRLLDTKLSKTAFQAIGFKEFLPHLNGSASLEECAENLKMQTRRYAKRQLTWFRRDERINWVRPDEFDGFGQVFERSCDIIDRSEKF